MSELFEILMIVLFGMSWPMNVIKSYKSRTTKGKSLLFLIFVLTGYFFGITGKLISGNYKWYVLFFYILNTTMVFTDFILYFRNKMIEKKDKETKAK